MNIKRAVLYTLLLGLVTTESFLGIFQRTADEVQLMLRNNGSALSSGLRLLMSVEDEKSWQNELKKFLIDALRQSRGEKRTAFLKALKKVTRLQKSNASQKEIVVAIRQIVGDIWQANVPEDWISSKCDLFVGIFNHALDIMHGGRGDEESSTEEFWSSTEDSGSALSFTTDD